MLLLIATTQVLAQINIQIVVGSTSPGIGICRQAMISNNSDHVWKIRIDYYMNGHYTPYADAKVGDPATYQHYVEVISYPGTSYEVLPSGLLDCSQPINLTNNWKGTDLTALGEENKRKRDEYNNEQERKRQEREEERRRKQQAEIDERNRKKAEELERQRDNEEKLRQIKLQQQQQEAEYLRAYRQASPENATCIINERADIAACERSKELRREERARQQALDQFKKDIDASRQRAEQEGDARVEQLSSQMEANNCSYATGAPSIAYPPQKPGMTNAEYTAELKRIDRLNYDLSIKYFEKTKAASNACDARLARERERERRAEEARRQAEEEARRLEAQRKARADLDAAIERGKVTVNEAENTTNTMKNDNSELYNLINNMK